MTNLPHNSPLLYVNRETTFVDGASVHASEFVKAAREIGEYLLVFPSRRSQQRRPSFRIRRVLGMAFRPLWSALRCIVEIPSLFALILRSRPRAILLRLTGYDFTALILALCKPTPVFIELNAPMFHELRLAGDVWWRLDRALEQIVLRSATGVVCVSQVLADLVCELVADKVVTRVVPNGVDVERFPAVGNNRPRDDSPFTLGFAGSLKPWHGLRNALRALALLPRKAFRLIVIGEGPERTQLEALAAELDVAESVWFVGQVPPEAVPRLLADCDVLLMPYEKKEPFYFSPLKMFEYMAAAKPIVATSVGQISEVLQHGESAILLDDPSPSCLAESIIRLSSDESLRRKLGERSRSDSLKYTWRVNAQAILDFIAGLERNESP